MTKKQAKYLRITILAIIIVLIIGVLVVYNKGKINQPSANDNKKVEEQNNVKTNTEGDRVFSDEEIKQYDEYMKQGHDYIIAGNNGDKGSYEKAVEVYKKASAIGNDKFWNPLMGLASAYRKLGRYDEADKAYDKALIASKYGEGSIYQERIDMYRYEMKKSNEDVKKVYEEALVKVTDNANLVLSYAAFSKEIGDYANAIKCYELLLEKFPDNKLYKAEIDELKAK